MLSRRPKYRKPLQREFGRPTVSRSDVAAQPANTVIISGAKMRQEELEGAAAPTEMD
jgi:hypothetical protein